MTTEQQYIRIDTDGSKRTYKDRDMNILHCKNGPAFEDANGNKIWYADGKLHRADGPAIERSNGSKQWHVNGNLHRIDGPAVEGANGTKIWYLDGKRFNEKEFNDQISPTLELTLEDIASKFGVDVTKVKIVK